MAIFYIRDGNDVYELTATTDVSVSYPSSVTRFKVEDGSTLTDHINIENASISFAGVITDIVRLNQDPTDAKDPKQYIEGLRAIQNAKRVFTVFVDNKLSPFNDCFFTNIGITKTIQNGLNSWNVSLSFEQIRKGRRAGVSNVQIVETVADADKDSASGKSDGGTKNTDKLPYSILNTIATGGSVSDSSVGSVIKKVEADIVGDLGDGS